MDTSKEFVKMCEKAEEIQKGWKPQNADIARGDFVGYIKLWEINQNIGTASLNRFSNDSETFGKYAWYEKSELTWLPRQDQLQEMAAYDIKAELISAFYNFAFRDAWCGKLNSMEQLWLAFVMKELYQKKWDGKEWIKNEGGE